MLFSQSTNKKGFVFLVELLIAIALLLAFTGNTNIGETNQTNFVGTIHTKRTASDLMIILDENGLIPNTLDANLTNDEKIETIFSEIQKMLGPTQKARLEIKYFDANISNCQISGNFANCFKTGGTSFPPKGNAIPDKLVTHENIVLVKKQPPANCYIGLASNNNRIFPKELPFKLYFAKEEPYKIYLQGTSGDQNISMGVDINVSGELKCDEHVKIDINAFFPDLGRYPADIMLVIDRSGSMGSSNGYIMSIGNISSGPAFGDDGTYSSNWGGCSNFGNWHDLNTFEIDTNMAENGFRIRTDFYGYNGSCSNARFRLKRPNNTITNSTYGGTYIEVDATAQTGTWTIQGWSDDNVTKYDNNMWYSKMLAAKNTAKQFIDFNDWNSPYDRIGLASFSSSSSLNQQLLAADDANKTRIKNEVDNLNANGSTAMGDGIHEATTELRSNRGRAPDSFQFQILLSDGVNNTGSNPITRANQAANNDIIIYTIGFGSDADETTLRQIANITDGNYYYAEDENTLNEVYEQISTSIGEIVAGQAYDANVIVPVADGIKILSNDANTYPLFLNDKNNLFWDIGTITEDTPWYGTYTLTIPCNSAFSCSDSKRVFPDVGSIISYIDGDTIFHEIEWDVNVTIPFKYRDLTLKILDARLLADNKMFIDVNISNIGYLDSAKTKIGFYLDDIISGNLITEFDSWPLCAGLDNNKPCNSFQIAYDSEVGAEGDIFAVVNHDNSVNECPGNNTQQISCYGSPKTQYFIIDLWVWNEWIKKGFFLQL